MGLAITSDTHNLYLFFFKFRSDDISLVIAVNFKIFKFSSFKDIMKIRRINNLRINILRNILVFFKVMYYYHNVFWDREMRTLWRG